MYGLVLAGGGARGAYEVGVWQALMDMGVEIGAVCGTSIGSINGAVFAQGDFDKAKKLWLDIRASDVISLKSTPCDNLLSPKNAGILFDEFKKNKALEMTPLENTLKSIIDEQKLLNSPIDFGLVTYSLSDLSQKELFKSDIPKGKLVDYLMASACLPGIKTRVIDNKAFVDGGVSDNKPIGMLLKKGYRDIIAVDVGGAGIVHSVKQTGLNIIEVNYSSPEIGMLEFDKRLIAKSIKTGYLETKRCFGQLSGTKYAIRTTDYVRTRRRLCESLIDGLEIAADIYGIEPLCEYSVTSLSRKVLKAYSSTLCEASGKTLELLVHDESRALLLTKAVSLLTGGEDSILNSKIFGSMFRDFSRAANSLAYFVNKSEI